MLDSAVMRARLFYGLFAVIATCASALACSALLGIDVLKNGPEPVDGSQPDTFVADATPEAATCTLVHPPARLDASDNGSTDFTIATRSMFFAISKPDTADIYYDLDGVCTCEIADAESCTRPAPGGQASPDTCDLSNGRDGTGNRAVSLLTAVPGFNDNNLGSQFAAGKFGALISVRGYNGKADDPHVRVDVARSFGAVGNNDAGQLVNAPLRNDGTDRWSYDPTIAKDDGMLITSKYFDDTAFVRGGVLVAHFDVLILNLQFNVGNVNQLSLRFTDATMTGTLEPSDAGPGLALNGARLVGRLTAGDLAKTFSVWWDPITGDNSTGICPGSPVFAAVTDKLCARLDVRATSAEDGKGLACNALSFGVGFTAGPATIYGGLGFSYKPTTCFDPKTSDPSVPGAFVCK